MSIVMRSRGRMKTHVLVLATIAALGVVAYIMCSPGWPIRRALAQVERVHGSARTYYIKHSVAPSITSLAAPDKRGWFYIEQGDDVDPWGKRLLIRRALTGEFCVVSSGPDQTHGTADDIQYPPKSKNK